MKKNFTDFVTCGQMKLLEQRADESGLSYYQMMENAGTGAAETIMERFSYRRAFGEDAVGAVGVLSAVAEKNAANSYEAAEGGGVMKPVENTGESALKRDAPLCASPNDDGNETCVMIFCGKGNNGGDGFVVARFMCQAGYRVSVVLVDGEPGTADSVTNFDLLKELPVRIIDMNDSDRALISLKEEPDIIVDAMYGTGFRGKLKGNALKAAIYINNRFKGTDNVILMKPVMVVALDIPSGLRGDMTTDKELDPCTVSAHYTITFHARKPVHLQSFAKKFCGEIIVADIGIDAEKLWDVGL